MAAKNSRSVPSATEPPRGTIASPNTVMMIEPVREGSRFSWSTMRASGCGMRERIPRFVDSRQWRQSHSGAMRSIEPGISRFRVRASRAPERQQLPVRIRVDQAAPAATVEGGPLAFLLRQAIGDRVDRGRVMAHAAMAALDLDALGHS